MSITAYYICKWLDEAPPVGPLQGGGVVLMVVHLGRNNMGTFLLSQRASPVLFITCHRDTPRAKRNVPKSSITVKANLLFRHSFQTYFVIIIRFNQSAVHDQNVEYISIITVFHYSSVIKNRKICSIFFFNI